MDLDSGVWINPHLNDACSVNEGCPSSLVHITSGVSAEYAESYFQDNGWVLYKVIKDWTYRNGTATCLDCCPGDCLSIDNYLEQHSVHIDDIASASNGIPTGIVVKNDRGGACHGTAFKCPDWGTIGTTTWNCDCSEGGSGICSITLWTLHDVYYWTPSCTLDCPPGSYEVGGICGPLPGYKPDPDNPGFFIPIHCIVVEKTEEYTHENGNTEYIYVGRTWTYRAYDDSGATSTVDQVIYLSYVGSGVTNGIEFDGPTSVILPAGEYSVDFEIKINENENAYQKFIRVTGTTELYDSCGIASNQILSEESTPVIENSYCSDMFFWQELICDDFFRPEEYTKFEIKRKGG